MAWRFYTRYRCTWLLYWCSIKPNSGWTSYS
jgi:hypothetical protein